MNPKARLWGRILTSAGVVVAVLAVLAFLSGCGKQGAPAQEGHEGHEHASADQPAPAEPMQAHASAEQPQSQSATEQKTCPVMEGNAINKNIFVEYKGKKVYFCCKACIDPFNADPEKYVSKLPQFQH